MSPLPSASPLAIDANFATLISTLVNTLTTNMVTIFVGVILAVLPVVIGFAVYHFGARKARKSLHV